MHDRRPQNWTNYARNELRSPNMVLGTFVVTGGLHEQFGAPIHG